MSQPISLAKISDVSMHTLRLDFQKYLVPTVLIWVPKWELLSAELIRKPSPGITILLVTYICFYVLIYELLGR